jgi:signal transduction histidine kinase
MAAEIDQAHLSLEKSRAHLIQSEKLATVGKLAAGMAHSVRNPLTSVKMRIFSLERSLRLNPMQKDDLEVISEEIRHIDTILKSFLEFARPPKLRFQMVSPSDVVDTAIQLLRHRFETYKTTVQVNRRKRLPRISADSDQLKEVLVNLMINACEAMGEGGSIHIVEEMAKHESFGDAVTIRIEDSGPGIPVEILEKIFEPFYSIKEEGSGLGLSIAKRIIEDHGGEISAGSKEGKGAVFSIVLPMKENIHG